MRVSRKASYRRVGVACVLCAWNLSLVAGCDRAPREPAGPEPAPEPVAEEESEPAQAQQETAGAGAGAPGSAEEQACVVPLADPPPPEVAPVDDCPADPEGRPEMPYGTVTFPDAQNAPQLKVELALTPADKAHGLMFRPTLGDEEGMLFSWQNEQQRFFWMKNTCLALDMLFIAADGTIAGILENVPPMNTRPQRTVACPAAHVLEVRAGWTRAYGVKPGQKMVVGPAQN